MYGLQARVYNVVARHAAADGEGDEVHQEKKESLWFGFTRLRSDKSSHEPGFTRLRSDKSSCEPGFARLRSERGAGENAPGCSFLRTETFLHCLIVMDRPLRLCDVVAFS